MRYAIISDLHSNRQALKAVLTDMLPLSIDDIICLGDIVGYGPSPRETAELALQKIKYFVLGNHDAVVCGKLSSEFFNDNARKVIEWTKTKLDPGVSKFLYGLPFMLSGPGFICTHGEFSEPGRYGYIIEPKEAEEAFHSCNYSMLFAGHSHVPCIFVTGASGKVYQIPPQDFALEEGKRYLVNVGSVGQPREGDIRASYVIFDTSKKELVFRKVPFDIEAYCEDVKKAGIPESASYFVSLYKNQPPKNIRDVLGFKRLDKNNAVKNVEEVRNLEKSVKNLKKTRTFLTVLLILTIIFCVGAVALYLAQKEKSQKIETELSDKAEKLKKLSKTIISPAKQFPINGKMLEIGKEILLFPTQKGLVSSTNPIDFWTVAMKMPDKQKIFVETETDKQGKNTIFRIISNEPSEMELIFEPISVFEGQRFSASAQFKRISLETGWIGIFLEQELDSGAKKILDHRIADRIKVSTNWCPISVTLENKHLKEKGRLRFVIRGEFKGEILVRKPSLRLKD